MIALDDKAPDFRLKGSDGKEHTLKEFSGKYLALYFYPKDDTMGCTIEAKGFNSQLEEIKRLGGVIVGVSADDLDSHGRFCSKYGLKFLLLSDTDSSAIKRYDAYGNRGVFGWGTLRKTYIIDKNGRIAKIFPKVNPMGHEKEILEFLRSQPA